MRTACFVGPSLPDLPPFVPRNVELLPPARCGDLLRAWRQGFQAVALVDGVFETGPTVWHKEILYLLGQGVAVYGAASLGAIRAAELDRFGMHGVGQVYAAYRDGALERDDAVMVLHAPPELESRALTVALVDAEATIAAAALADGDRIALRRIARGCSFRTRDWEGMVERFASLHGIARARAVAAAIQPALTSVKQADTVLLLAALAHPSPPALLPAPPHTPFLDRLLRQVEHGSTD